MRMYRDKCIWVFPWETLVERTLVRDAEHMECLQLFNRAVNRLCIFNTFLSNSGIGLCWSAQTKMWQEENWRRNSPPVLSLPALTITNIVQFATFRHRYFKSSFTPNSWQKVTAMAHCSLALCAEAWPNFFSFSFSFQFIVIDNKGTVHGDWYYRKRSRSAALRWDLL